MGVRAGVALPPARGDRLSERAMTRSNLGDDDEAIFTEALAIGSPEEREAYLRRACAGRPDLLGEVLALLRAHEQSRGALEVPPVTLGLTSADGDSDPSTPSASSLPAGSLIAGYKLLER